MNATDDLAASWWRAHAMASGPRDERLDLARGTSATAEAARSARQHVHDCVDGGGDEALRMIERLLALAPDSHAAGLVGAGPLEDLVHQHGDQLVESIETSARTSPRFAEALRSVWLEAGSLSPDTEMRLGRWIES